MPFNKNNKNINIPANWKTLPLQCFYLIPIRKSQLKECLKPWIQYENTKFLHLGCKNAKNKKYIS